MGDSYVIALDFGTAYSGYAFNITTSKEESDPRLKRWGADQGLDTPKTLTCILFDQNEEFLKFGYEAKKTYIKMRGEEAKKHYLFEGFKMALYGKDLNKNFKIKAANDKEMTALKVFSESLRFLKDDALKTINSKVPGQNFTPSDFTWVLTVPAIWDESAKQFMREAATQAGIVTEGTEDKLMIALEPEAASVWCKKLPSDGFITQNHNSDSLDQTPGTQSIIVDCGGGTIDITVHEVLKRGALKEKHKASGNNLGGKTVDRKFKKFIREIFTDGVWDEYKEMYPSEVQRMIFEFRCLKQVDEDIEIPCPFNLGKLARKKKDIEKFFESVQGASWNKGVIKISKEKLRSFYDESLQGMTKSLKEILEKDLNIDFILLVGGFADSQILRQHIIEQFGGEYKILCPVRPQEAILRGAVEFGRNPKIVTYRRSRFTYGVAVLKKFDESEHKQEKKLIADGKEWCKDIFKILLEEGQDVAWNETKEHYLNAADPKQTQMSVRLFRTEKKNPEYVDDCGVEEIGSFVVKLCNSKTNQERKVKIELKFGSTEIRATGTDLNTGKKSTLKFEFKNV
ncbi:heat shock 70 kDa protein 12A-like isoform X1 [Xiphophorus hellerii]|uniref:heat shock 70 kDa protein 12A-like isoform X1 n=1 Tax=Xiphophorus hellerii TaxID=8084 RepID=UPI0013B40B7E|nr:heat shock 70 kDa protein 12A-like isoform X1 [Xiphophorus hellerii]